MKNALQFSFAIAVLSLATLSLFAQEKTFTGQVSDVSCGAKHAMAGNPAKCTRACVGKGGSYALVAADKVYTLQSQNQKASEKLDKMAGKQAKITGDLSGDTIKVSSVSLP